MPTAKKRPAKGSKLQRARSGVQRKKSIKSTRSGHIRIIGGQWRSRKLPVHDIEGLRPTTDRVKETLFNWLMPYVREAKVLDCFAGSGGLGLEALSRGSASTDFIELDKVAAAQIKSNLETLNCCSAKVHIGNSIECLSTLNSQFDLIFIDPPFRKQLAQPCCDLLAEKNLLKDGAVIYLETEVELSPISLSAEWQLLKEKTAGQVCYRLFQYKKS